MIETCHDNICDMFDHCHNYTNRLLEPPSI